VTAPHLNLPIDETSRARLASAGLTLRLVDTADPADHAGWSDALTRGFLGPATPAEQTEARRGLVQDDRLVGVYDPTAAVPDEPVATTRCWPAELTLPGGRTTTAWAVSAVTVSQTHRRRGIARALMEAELRTASALGLPLAMLTVTESTLYGRYGYSPAAFARDLTIATRRVRWTGPDPTGRVHHVTPQQLRDQGHPIVERIRATRPGEVGYAATSGFWLRQIGLGVGDDNAKNLRLVRYDDADGDPQGFAVYQMVKDETDVTDHAVTLHTLVAARTDAYAGLWRYLLEMDLVSKVTAHLRPVDEPLRWMIDDFRAIRVDERDHLWLRVLDVPAVLQARTYSAPGRLVIGVDDPLGFASGTFALDVDADGRATVSGTGDAPEATLTVNALGSLLLGGVTARTLAAAGAVGGDAERLDAMFYSPVEPFLSTWF
jgi:predicted acetyltransferase